MKATRTILSLLLALCLLAGMAGCAAAGGDEETESPAESGETDATESGAASANPGAELTALELTVQMGNGIDLGNTFEAYGRTTYGTGADPVLYETFWGAPETTQEMIQGMKDAGFDTLRIPVAWTNTMDYESGDYTISEAYLERVHEVVGWAIDAGMFVILNDHWDGSWWGMFGSATESTVEAAWELYESMWTQVGTYFNDFDYHLIFESANEELGNRLNDTDVCADSGTLSTDECYETMNAINQKFVDVIRSLGSYNSDRFLLIAGYNTNISDTLDDRFQMPTDTAESKLLLPVHYYDPTGYALNGSVANWGRESEVRTLINDLASLSKFTAQGYGVIIGEWGVLRGAGELAEDQMDYYSLMIAVCEYNNLVPVLWDTGGMYNRSECKLYLEEVEEFFVSHSYSWQSENMTADEIDLEARTVMSEQISLGRQKDEEAVVANADEVTAWIMYNSADWGTTYSVGDSYDPMSITTGVVATDATVTGDGTYTVSLDFTGTSAGYAEGTVFCALGLYNAEILFPGCVVEITEVAVDGTPIELADGQYTTTDDDKCTRVNLYNSWITATPSVIRTVSGSSDWNAMIITSEQLGTMHTLSVTFNFYTAD